MRFHVPEMSCGHCTATITKEIAALDPLAKVTTDLEQQFVAVETALSPDEIVSAIKAAGYDATPT
ncbi:heavy-metal-associated domain-containing protein [Palleronia caenipelagi]|uniref:Heavy-metal-associated domain-containing protein n=1 Tax=Palleronia caenipelagi TaxID=2489174 RepID=A0A547PN68_9RHOB|nr:heavy-metal-associated domain-containing protein [Palleronia caenipelagi]TRD15598.1 heavy-metal-associated domain-containing protein [Palleronia caenipelagi]